MGENMTQDEKELGVIVVREDGSMTALYDDSLNMAQEGDLSVERLSHVEFDPALNGGEWYVEDAKTGKILYSNQSRELCLKWERKHFNEILVSGDHEGRLRK